MGGSSSHRGFRGAARAGVGVAMVCLVAVGVPASGAEVPSADELLAATGVRGGLVVQIGCGGRDAVKLLAALGTRAGYLVHGLDAEASNVAKAREQLRSAGLYGKVSVEQWPYGHLPYADGLVNLLVVTDATPAVSSDELLRVLCPGGVAYVRQSGKWTKQVRPRPDGIDEWTHYLYDASNNAVSKDSVVGPPHQLRWVGGPRWARSHDHLASVSAAVSAGGRIFYIADKGPIAAVVLQPKWVLTARDAYSGVVLWRREIAKWQYHLRGFRSGPSDLAKRLVAVGDRVYVPLGLDQPLSALDAATGETVATYRQTKAVQEVVYRGGNLYVVAGDPSAAQAAAKAAAKAARRGLTPVRPQRPAYRETLPPKRIVAVRAADGQVLWAKADAGVAELMPTTLAVAAGHAYCQTPDHLLCLDARSGKEIWRADRRVSRSRPSWSTPTLVAYGDVVLSADRAVAKRKTDGEGDGRKIEWIVSSAGGRAPVGELIAFAAKDGKRLWSCKCQECYNAPVDVLVAAGCVWTGQLVRASQPGITEGRDPKTGEVRRTRPRDQQFFQPGMGHGRCHRNRGTARYLVLGRSGVEFIDLATGRGIANHWTRGTCQYGVLPCNGLLYTPPHSCACFITAKLDGFNCFAPTPAGKAAEVPELPRLHRGPAYPESGKRKAESGAAPALAEARRAGARPPAAQSPQSTIRNPQSSDWPTYRHDAARSGCTASAVPGELKRTWQVDLGGRLSPVVVAGGRLFVARIDAQAVCALDAETGKELWAYTAGGRVDSPPTVWRGRVLFGCEDGCVYCLRASDGKLAWRFRAAPREQRIVAYGRVASAWPVHGSVLVFDKPGEQAGVVYCAAGRTSYLAGGLRLCRLDANSGRLLSQTVIDHRDPKTGHQPKGVTHGTNIPGALGDVLSCDGTSVYMRHTRFDLKGGKQTPTVKHLFSPAGFLDDSWWHRTYWLVGTSMATNYGGWPRSASRAPAGRLLVVGPRRVYGFGRNQYAHHGAHIGIDAATVFHFRPPRDSKQRQTYYRLFATEPGGAEPTARPKAPARRRRRAPPAKAYRWTRKLPILARAMVLAGDVLWTAGPPDLLDCDDPLGALAGRKGGKLIAVAADDGKDLAAYPLACPPVFDGLAAANGKLYLATLDGKVVCMGAAGD